MAHNGRSAIKYAILFVMLPSLLTFLSYGTLQVSRKIQRSVEGLQSYNDNTQENTGLVYRPPIAPHVQGKRFDDINITFLESLLPDPIELRKEDLMDFVFVSAISAPYLHRLKFLTHTIQQWYLKNNHIVFDLGLEPHQVKFLNSLCQVEVRKFNFNKYPTHVRELKSYSFKPIVITEVMKEGRYKGVFWVDGSIRFKTDNMTVLHRKVMESNGLGVFTGTDHSVFSVTVPQMFEYLPIMKDPEIVECLMATTILMYRTNNVVNNIIRWWVACALSRSCMANRPYSSCRFARRNRWTEFASCSRYDQSALSILLYNTYANIDVALAYRIWGPGINGTYLRIDRGDSIDTLKKKNCTV